MGLFDPHSDPSRPVGGRPRLQKVACSSCGARISPYAYARHDGLCLTCVSEQKKPALQQHEDVPPVEEQVLLPQTVFCQKCKKEYPSKESLATATVCTDCFADLPSEGIIEVMSPDQDYQYYDDFDALRRAMVSGGVRKHHTVRRVAKNEKATSSWTTVEDLARADFKTEVLYRPVRAHMMKCLLYGALAGLALKAFDTTISFYAVDSGIGFAWLLMMASGIGLAKRWGWIAGLPAFILCKISPSLLATMLGAAFGTTVVGVALGGPLGMIVGTVIGHNKAGRLPRAADAEPEGPAPYYYGLVAPILFLAIAIPAYIWFNSNIDAWLSGV